jgi:hypothetical protein
MPTSASRSPAALRHGIPSSGLASTGSFQKLAKLGLIAIANIPKLVTSHPTLHPSHGSSSSSHGSSHASNAFIKKAEDPGFWVYFGVAVSLVLLGGVFAGLTLG